MSDYLSKKLINISRVSLNPNEEMQAKEQNNPQ